MNILILGNGQLGQMLAQATIRLGHACLLVNTRTNQVMPAGAHVPMQLSIAEAVDWADIVSWEHEQLDPEHVQLAADKLLTDPAKILPLTHRQLEKQLCDDLDIATAPWVAFDTQEQFQTAVTQWQGKAVIKAASGGYDGKSQWRYNSDEPGDLVALGDTAGRQPGIIEAMIPFQCEVSIVGARAADGRIQCYPLVENVHRNGILSHTFAGFNNLPAHLQQKAEHAFRKITEHLGYVGTLAIEFFVVGAGDSAELLVNEIAPRVHNSGHWSMQGTNISQFALHIRALTNMPFAPFITQPTLMVNAIGIAQIPDSLWQDGEAAPFWYGKEARPGRKVGHVNFHVNDRAGAEALAAQWAPELQILS
ncbi:ATP-grasp domain-containing protein [Aliidiomarina halalkaliphila]|uniref:N5-carboxyaminoimidazole ribonucleotide synthase n=1 Tax=Aliidiomarina halalkaliphila TaxID=2593535 RepID=A0A552X1Q2_9GAMM|nr:ATP-grasp domain-containing protein [Aliidiomarina halalkaliphila]TRW48944.1 ATP-grasp domain-containing protein [Aliidiomarina halalkaliphila]